MGLRIIVGNEQGCHREHAVLFCSTSQWAFGPVFDSEEDADEFIKWLPRDAREYTADELEHLYGSWKALKQDA
jgi:hypothetical protein